MVVESAGDADDTGVSVVDDEFVENDDPLSEARVGLSKCGVKLLEFLHNMFEGGMDADFRALASQDNPVAILMDTQVAEGGSAGRLAREVIRLMSSLGQVVLSTGDAPPVSLRSLARLKSDPDSDGAEVDRVREQRADVWGQAQQQRRKYVQVSVWQGKKKEGLASIFAKSRVSDFKGTAKESHRAFFFSADLAPEHPTEPWNLLNVDDTLYTAVFDFLKMQAKPFDFLFVFDGRSRPARRKVEDLLDQRSHVSECWIIYNGLQKARPMKKKCRRVALSALNREVMYVALPFSRTSLPLRDRDVFNASGELSTYNTTYSGVPMRDVRSLPLISPEDKTKIMGDLPADAPEFVRPALPLYWQESKPVGLFRRLIQDFDIDAIFDLTPGSGALAEAAMEAGKQYGCACTSAAHASWLQNVMDRSAARLITQDGAALHLESLAALLREHFSEVLDEYHDPDAEDGEDVSEEEEQEDDGMK